MAKKPICDTSVFSDYGDHIDKIILSVLFPTVVLFELVAAKIDESVLRRYDRWRRILNRNGYLLNPTATDWWETAKAVRRLYLIKGIQPSKLKTIRNDAMIARLAVMHGGFVVTHDTDDFELLQRVMPELSVVPAVEFFGS